MPATNVVRSRFAPSPTGFLHVGGARTALFAWLQARRHGGQFVLRIEDTDRERSTQASVDAILESMDWLGLEWDEGPIYQTHRFERYLEVANAMLDAGQAYKCTCSRERLDTLREEQRAAGLKPRYDGHCRERALSPPDGTSYVVRFANPAEGVVEFDDRVRGNVVIPNSELDDLIIVRSDGSPTYNFTVVVDDTDMNITEVIRGDDHVNNTPRQINIMRALGKPVPVFAHLPMILGPDGQRLSKRHGAVSVTQFRDEGYLPQAMLNYLARLGWSHGDAEVFSREALVSLFDVADVNKSAASFDMDKLQWLNQQYIQQAASETLGVQLAAQLRTFGVDPDSGPAPSLVADLMRERARTLQEMAEKSLFAYREPEGYDEKSARKHLTPESAAALRALATRLGAAAAWEADPLHQLVADTAEALEIKMGKLAQPLRISLTGSAASPGIGETLVMVGRERALARIEAAAVWVDAQAAAG